MDAGVDQSDDQVRLYLLLHFLPLSAGKYLQHSNIVDIEFLCS